MTTLSILVDDDRECTLVFADTLDTGSPDYVDPVTDLILGMQCAHCGGGLEELHAPLTCGCVICNCMCPCWHECPKGTPCTESQTCTDQHEQPSAVRQPCHEQMSCPETEMKRE
jgi:hypothetical protein